MGQSVSRETREPAPSTPDTKTCGTQTSPLLTLTVEVRSEILRQTGLVRPCPISFEWESARILKTHMRRLPYATGKCFPDKEDYKQPDLSDLYQIWWESDQEEEFRANYDYEATDEYRSGINDPLKECTHEPLPTPLLLTCKQLYWEATKILYSENAFSLNCYSRTARQSFCGLGDVAFASLRRLHIIYMSNRDPIRHTDSLFERFQRPWKTVCRALSNKILPNRLRLSFECFPKDVETQRLILEPLQHLPKLRHLCPNAGHFNDHDVERICRLHGERLVMSSANNSGFSWGCLPRQLQELVLKHSGLVTHPSAITNFRKRLELSRGTPFDKQGRPHPRIPRCCGTCDEDYIWCFCNRAGDGKYSSSCSCPRLAVGLFSANKYVAHLSMRVFYGENQFYIAGTVSEIMTTLSLIPPDRLRLMKRLCLDGQSLLDRNLSEWQDLFDYFTNYAHPDLVLKILVLQPWAMSIFGGEDPEMWVMNFNRWFANLCYERVSVLGPVYDREEDVDRIDVPFNRLWVTIAGPPTTLEA